MTKTTKAPKTVKITTSSDISNDIKGAYSNLINHDGEIAFILEIAQYLAEGKATVRGVQDAIAECQGTAPTIRKSHVQHFTLLADIVSNVKGAEDKTVADLLKLAERVGRNHGAEGARAVIDEVANVAELEEKSPTQTNARKNGGKNKVAAPLTIENVIVSSLEAIRRAGGKSLKDATTQDLDSLRALLSVLVTISKNTDAKVKASA